ncbi:hypothetical protein [Polynucleobacter kasalickyi]|uniref:O-antigen ligase domain-containing protein n=1 Tax=Polynucleobacter kasalickyi TaxID=1938817 RepID=A0A1W2CA42_9BURK|nr:hypothetical protein [Polynucleobacter kasalickyi]SMC82040.1 hypothetical protein SAMN06296008_12110 [Polynucleobacter kasalickyi]
MELIKIHLKKNEKIFMLYLTSWFFLESQLLGLVNINIEEEKIIRIISTLISLIIYLSYIKKNNYDEKLMILKYLSLFYTSWVIAITVGMIKWGGGLAFGEISRFITFLPLIMIVSEGYRRILRYWLINIFRYIGYYFMIITILFVGYDIQMPGYSELESYDKIGLHIVPVTVFNVLLIIELYRINARLKKIIIILLIFICGWYEGHRSLLIMNIAILLGYYLEKNNIKNIGKVLLITISVFIIMFSNIFIENITTENYFGNESLISRSEINKNRYEDALDNLMLGVGLVSNESSISKSYEYNSLSRFDETVRVIDGGFLDLALKFGIIGTLIYFISLYVNIKKINSRNYINAAIILIYFGAGFTLSLFTFYFGIFLLYSSLTITYYEK